MMNIYYELTKQRTSQSVRMKGARKAYDFLETFLQKHTTSLKFGRVSIDYFVWTNSWRATRLTLNLEDQPMKDFGTLKNYNTAQAAIAKVDPFDKLSADCIHRANYACG